MVFGEEQARRQCSFRLWRLTTDFYSNTVLTVKITLSWTFLYLRGTCEGLLVVIRVFWYPTEGKWWVQRDWSIFSTLPDGIPTPVTVGGNSILVYSTAYQRICCLAGHICAHELPVWSDIWTSPPPPVMNFQNYLFPQNLLQLRLL
jgi:hypothetical protein